MTIFDLMQSQELTAYWEELIQDEAPYPCEELFPVCSQLLALHQIENSHVLSSFKSLN